MSKDHVAEIAWTFDYEESCTQKYVLSPVFTNALGHEFQLKCYPRGIKATQPPYLSLFFSFLSSKKYYAKEKQLQVKYQVLLEGNAPSVDDFFTKSSKVFDVHCEDWGYAQLISCDALKSFLDPKGQLCIHFRVKSILPTVETTDPFMRRAVQAGDMVGLYNLGATCYLNSFLQCLYHLAYFRKVIYHIPADEQQVEDRLIFVLQSIFHRLQVSDFSVDPKELITAFGWNDAEGFVQRDMHELSSKLYEYLEMKMKGGMNPTFIRELFGVTVVREIRCKHVAFVSKGEEKLLDLTLPIKGYERLEDSLAHYVKVELMDGANQYHAEGHGLQDAELRHMIARAGPVLGIHLMRFEMDYEAGVQVKVDDHFAFPEELDLSPYMSPGTLEKDTKYVLFCVYVHKGRVDKGHYFCYIRPQLGQWYKFNDRRVCAVDREKVFAGTFGGTKSQQLARGNAYMLVYIKKSRVDEMLVGVLESAVSEQVKALNAKKEEDARLNEEQRTLNVLCREVYIVTPTDLFQHHDVDLVNFRNIESQMIEKQKTFGELRAELAAQMGYEEKAIRLWEWRRRVNGTIRPDILLTKFGKRPIGRYRPNVALRILVETLDISNAQGNHFISMEDDHVLLFFKYYNPSDSKLGFLGMGVYNKRGFIRETYSYAYGKLQNHQDPMVRNALAHFKVCNPFEEVKPSMIEQLHWSRTILASQLVSGDIITIHAELDSKVKVKYPTCKGYYEYLESKSYIQFKPLAEGTYPEVCLTLDKNMGYLDIAKALADELSSQYPGVHDHIHLANAVIRKRHVGHMKQTTVEAGPLINNTTLKLSSMVDLRVRDSECVLYYEVVPYAMSELRTKNLVEVLWREAGTSLVTDRVRLLLDRKGTVADALGEVRQWLKRDIAVHLLALNQSLEIWKKFQGEEPVMSLQKYAHLLAEPDEGEAGQVGVVVDQMNSRGENSGYSFYVYVDREKTAAEVMPSILEKVEKPLRVDEYSLQAVGGRGTRRLSPEDVFAAKGTIRVVLKALVDERGSAEIKLHAA